MDIEIAFVATSAATVLLAVIAVAQMAVSRRSTNNATLPIVVPEEIDRPDWREDGLCYRYVLRNEGRGPALNVEHGVELDGARLSFGEDGSPFKFRTAREGAVLPTQDPTSYDGPRAMDPVVGVPGGDAREPERVYWTRYESLHGETYESRTAYEPSSNLEFRRVSRARGMLTRVGRPRWLALRVESAPLVPRAWSGHRAEFEHEVISTAG